MMYTWKKKKRKTFSWMQEVTTRMRGERINNMEWIDKEKWRSKINLKVQKDVKTSRLCK